MSFRTGCRLLCNAWFVSHGTLYALRRFPTQCQWHDVSTLYVWVKRFAGVQRGLSLKAPFGIPLPLFDGEAERAETATESEVVAVRVGKEVGTLQTELAVAVE